MALISEEELAKIKEDKEASRFEGKIFAKEAGVRSEAAAKNLRKLREEGDKREKKGAGAIDAATKDAQVRARRRSAKGIAAAQGAGGFGSGAKSAQLQEVGQKLGEDETKIGVGGALNKEGFLQKSQQQRFGQENVVGQAEVDASVQKLEGTKFSKEAGTELEDRQAKGAAYVTQMAEIKAAHKGEGFFEPDDEEGALKAIKTLVELEEDPALRKILQDEVDRIESFTFIDMAF